MIEQNIERLQIIVIASITIMSETATEALKMPEWSGLNTVCQCRISAHLNRSCLIMLTLLY